MITAANLHRSYSIGKKSIEILHGVNLHIAAGEKVFLCGPSGAGKTTLMYTLAGLETPQEGKVTINGTDIYSLSATGRSIFRNRNMGFIFQNYQLIPTYNVMQNIIMPLLMRGMTHEEAEEKCKNTIKLLGLDHRIGHKPNELSGGQKQRVSIARALVGQPAILLADEPTGALDQTSGREVLKLFWELNDMGNTIVMITHDLGVAQFAKRIVRIVDGQLQE